MRSKDHLAEQRLKPGMSGLPEPELILVKGGARAYLWLGWKGGCLGTLHGPRTLRKLARQILAEIPAAQRKKRGGRDG